MVDLPSKVPVREVRALEMLHGGVRVAQVLGSDGEYIVPSESRNGFYRVRIGPDSNDVDSCTCSDFLDRLVPCKHIFLVRFDRTAESNPVRGYPLPSPRAPPKRNWSLYDSSQVHEHRLFHTLLRDLSTGVPEPQKVPHSAGRPPIPMRDQVFSAVQRAYLGFSLRRSHGFRDQAARDGLLSKTPYWAVASRFLCRQDVTEGLHDMLARSAIPLVHLEDRCAIDSTGLRTSQFHYYRREKYEPKRESAWDKLHAMVGVRTHVMPVLEVTAGAASDSPQFPVLLRRANQYGFRFKEVLADRGYQARGNFNAARELGVLPFIPFKRNQTGEAKGSPLYHKMFKFFVYRREEFDEHYRQRAQVESAFGSIKQKFGETLSSKNFTAQLNEIICIGIAHNITVLIRQMFESGILPDFLPPPLRAELPRVPDGGGVAEGSLSLNSPGGNPAVIQCPPAS